MGRNEYIYTKPMHWGCANGTRNSTPNGFRGCHDSDCPNRAFRKSVTNRLRRNNDKKVIRAAINDL